MKILLFGKGGQVGWELQRSLAPLGELISVDVDSTDLCGDFSNLPGIAATVRAVRPDVVVNAAAHTAVDKAESEPEFAHVLNALAPGILAEEAQKLGAWLVHYSTDYVFDGSGTRAWAEGDQPNPHNVYGKTKLEGELLVAGRCEKHLIFRTSWVYAARGANFAKTMLKLAQERDRLTVIDDQHGAPTGADLLADVTAHALRKLAQSGSTSGGSAADAKLAGIYHLVAGGSTTWHGYASEVVSFARNMRPNFAMKVTEISPVPTSAYVTPAKRPLNSRMDTSKLRATFGLSLPRWQDGVRRMLTEIL